MKARVFINHKDRGEHRNPRTMEVDVVVGEMLLGWRFNEVWFSPKAESARVHAEQTVVWFDMLQTRKESEKQ